jgi:hypothetical protein
LGYPKDEKPIFIGHYWQSGTPKIFDNNIACVDYSASKSDSLLVAYRFYNEKKLSNKNFISHKKLSFFDFTRKFFKTLAMLLA